MNITNEQTDILKRIDEEGPWRLFARFYRLTDKKPVDFQIWKGDTLKWRFETLSSAKYRFEKERYTL